MKKCYCDSGKNFADCCQPFLLENAKPQTAEQLMRSRYSAFVTVNVEYILKSTHPLTRKFHNAEQIKTWAESSVWQKLEIVNTENGTEKDKQGTVEFKAYYADSISLANIHHEISNFAKELGKWFFVDGKIL